MVRVTISRRDTADTPITAELLISLHVQSSGRGSVEVGNVFIVLVEGIGESLKSAVAVEGRTSVLIEPVVVKVTI